MVLENGAGHHPLKLLESDEAGGLLLLHLRKCKPRSGFGACAVQARGHFLISFELQDVAAHRRVRAPGLGFYGF